MINANFGGDFIIGCVFVGAAMLVGLFVLFSKSENIERPFVVGGMTLSSSLIAIILLDHLRRTRLNFGFGDLLAVCLLAAFGFGLGRVLDRLLGPCPDECIRKDGLGADLAE